MAFAEPTVTSEAFLREILTPRPRQMHKGQCGRLLLVAGSTGMAGAAILCARAALRSGAGLVTIAAPVYLFHILQTAVPEAMCVDLESLTERNLNTYDSIAVGPGIGVSEERYRDLEHILLSYRGPVIVDADGINNLCTYGLAPEIHPEEEALQGSYYSAQIPRKRTSILPDITRRRKSPVILTPHPGEADRLMETLDEASCGVIGRKNAAARLALASGAIVVLKGADSLVATANPAALGAAPGSAEVDLYLNPTGNPGMATGGSGDVLTGVCAALVGQGQAAAASRRQYGMDRTFACGLNPLHAVRAAVYLHGLAGDIAAERLGETGMTAMDLAEALPEAFRRIIGR